MTRRIYVVRHARAGDRERWTEADRLRPLTRLGERQARALARPLRAAGVRRVVSSPYVRCLDTMRPFGEARCVPVARDDALAEGASHRAVRALLGRLPDATALCTHGDIIAGLLDAAMRGGVALPSRRRLAKASIWILDVGAHGTIERARYRPPPTLT
ncbi:MAG TPA: phosphoglycerate mutase family protein [Candidatus Limnocylindria bacterium]